MARRSPPRKVTYFEPGATAARRQHHHRVHIRGRSSASSIADPPANGSQRMPERLDQEELADCRAGRDAVYQLAALTVGARLAVADG
jgi:hypothetical protein